MRLQARASAAQQQQGGWELSSTVKLGTGRGSAKSAADQLPTSSADIELLQSTLTTYSERMNELVQENLALKGALRNLEAELQGVLTKQNAEYETDVAVDNGADGAAATVPLDENGVPISSSSSSSIPPPATRARCLSPPLSPCSRTSIRARSSCHGTWSAPTSRRCCVRSCPCCARELLQLAPGMRRLKQSSSNRASSRHSRPKSQSKEPSFTSRISCCNSACMRRTMRCCRKRRGRVAGSA